MVNKELFNCPNCGAVITGNKCEYCGTVFKEKKTAKFSIATEELMKALDNFYELI